MRSLKFAAIAALTLAIAPPAWIGTASAEEGCTGQNCQPQGQSGGHDCERQKKEDTVS